jgi:uracil DNA glycosylase
MLSKEDKDRNRTEYFEKAKAENIKLILIGQDPYPDKIDNGIAFCKDEINKLNRTCFPTICRSLDLPYQDYELKFNNDGKKLFHFLLIRGIVFMNLSYELFVKGSDKSGLIFSYHKINWPVIEHFPSAKVIKLGLNYETQFKTLYGNGEIIVHPSALARRHEKWSTYWEKQGALIKKYSIKLNR